ncbi:hypothetical protein [Clostridium botulinum]|uniref:Uncharacterized protein n=1 Tax=Clostridium botulinum TaxID=1491 RepID=A0A9Q1UYL1_CLOBO|nr:hypothetical protein [Clostridium botulinum]AEB77090.1 hypothetical protein CbC4_2425 [Clostridium botulinum BKT015925]KEI00672.1 hypothetical protein Z953_09820 [Clostridium botulinum D str. 16868]KEI05873.1 hypothetical protein Y848_00235 [Clostridium botulinum C/D str. Sp77]KLU75540.1 hypothetical protein CBC3_08555 [Clostridium botulinum V891]KOA78684.1 hypothetical protein ADU77_05695 [Clostridium botulinum]
MLKLLKKNKDNQYLDKILTKFIDGYVSCTQSHIASVCIDKEIKHLISAIDNEKEIHIRNNESLDKVTEILGVILKREDISKEERQDIYKLLSQISNLSKEGESQRTRQVTSRIISAMGIAASVAISLGTVLVHEKYKTQREREKWNNYFYKGQ